MYFSFCFDFNFSFYQYDMAVCIIIVGRDTELSTKVSDFHLSGFYNERPFFIMYYVKIDFSFYKYFPTIGGKLSGVDHF